MFFFGHFNKRDLDIPLLLGTTMWQQRLAIYTNNYNTKQKFIIAKKKKVKMLRENKASSEFLIPLAHKRGPINTSGIHNFMEEVTILPQMERRHRRYFSSPREQQKQKHRHAKAPDIFRKW